MNLIEFSDCKLNERHGRYGGAAGDKDGITYNGENWLIKFPKSTRSIKGDDLASYTTSPLSEYIGSHVYEILGYDVHKTLLGIRNDKVVVACKDFQKHLGDLAEIRTLKNAANREISQMLDDDLPESATGDKVVLEELLLHFDINPLLNRDDVKARFWDCVLIDILIDNNDRNNGNWGLLFNEETKGYDLAPIYDNGNAFNNKATDEHLEKLLKDESLTDRLIGTRTAYEYQGHILSSKKMLQLNYNDIAFATSRVVPKMLKHLNEIKDMINDIPAHYKDYPVMSDVRRQYYIRALECRLNYLLILALETHK